MTGPVPITVQVCDQCEYVTPSRCGHPEAPTTSEGLLTGFRGHQLTPFWCPVVREREAEETPEK